jgi:DNA-binding MarR family transcriptional regulator
MKVCAKAGEDAQGALFQVEYGPKAGQDSGRCRWLFLTSKGRQLIDAAREDRIARETAKRNRPPRSGGPAQDAPSDDIRILSSVDENGSDRSPRNTPTLLTRDSALNTSFKLSKSAREISKGFTEDKEQGEGNLNRLQELWTTACYRSNRHDLIWRETELKSFKSGLQEIASLQFIRDMPDERLLVCLTLLCRQLSSFKRDMSDAFWKFNKSGLRAQSFSKYGLELVQRADKMITANQATESMLKASDL